MLSYEEFQSLAQRLNAVLSDFLAVDVEIANCGLKPYDFSQSTARLETIGSRIKTLREELLRHSAQAKGKRALQVTLAYIDCLLASQQQLSAISSRLAAKAEGKGYGFFAYGKDMRAYKKCEKSRLALGPELNIVVRQSW